MKKLMIASIALMNIAFANDVIVEQSNITRDAVQIALEEFSQGKIDIPESPDAQEKLVKFNAEAEVALKRFEQAVRIRILQSLSVIVKQYNSIYKNNSLGIARQEILKSLKSQIDQIVADKSNIYREAHLELYSILPEMPAFLKFTSDRNGRITYSNYVNVKECKDDSCTYNSYVDFDNEVYYTKSKSRNFSQKRKPERYSYQGLNNYFFNFIDPAEMTSARRGLLQECYTSTCYFHTQGHITIWKSLVESSLGRDIEIKLEDGTRLTISRKNEGKFSYHSVLGSYLSHKTEGLINELPVTISPERLSLMKQLEAALPNGGYWCRSIKTLSEKFCQETQEGCLKPSEVALIKDRFNTNCL